MAVVTRNTYVSLASKLPTGSNRIGSGFIVGQNIVLGDAVNLQYNSSTNQFLIMQAIASANNNNAIVHGFAASNGYVAQNDAVTIWDDVDLSYGNNLSSLLGNISGENVVGSQQLHGLVPAATATTSVTTPVGLAPFNGTITAITYTPEANVVGATATERTLTLNNKTQTLATGTLVTSTGNSLAIGVASAFTLNATPANLIVNAGDLLSLTTADTSTGTADPGGFITVTIAPIAASNTAYTGAALVYLSASVAGGLDTTPPWPGAPSVGRILDNYRIRVYASR